MTTMKLMFESDEIAATADRLWEITAVDFDDIAIWASGLSASRRDDDVPDLVGAEVGGRVCEVPGSGQLFERLLTFDPGSRTFSFSARPEKAPGFLADFRMYWTIHEKSSESSVASGHVSAELTGLVGFLMRPMMKLTVKRMMADLMVDLKTYGETGGFSDKKRKALRKLAKAS